ncbi:MAG: PTS transporter subunit EIIC, partial [Clostridium sp.]
MKFMDKLAAGLEKFLMPIAEKLGRQKQLCALRDGFIGTLPIFMAGSLGSLFLNVFFKADSLIGAKLNTMGAYAESVQPFITKYINPIVNNMWWGTLALTSIFIVLTIAYALGRQYEVDPLATALTALAAFLTLIPDAQPISIVIDEATKEAVNGSAWGMLSWGNFNSTAMFTAMIVALVAGQLFIFLTKKGFTIKMPEQVPPAVSKAFAAV